MKFKNLFKIMAGSVLASALLISCEEESIKQNTLEVVPASTISFKASGNVPVEMVVTTDADDWDFTAPEWIEAAKEGNKLTVNAKDNTESSRLGRISFTAGNADKVSVSVLQASASGVEVEASARLVDVTGENDINVSVPSSSPVYTTTVKLVLDEPAKSDMEVKIAFDMDYTEEYSFEHDNIEVENLPIDKIKADASFVIAEGQTESEFVTLTFDCTDAAMQTNYLVSVVVDEDSCPGLVLPVDGKRINYLLKKKLPKEVKNVVYLEVNNTNPLNMLEYMLEDGTPFFDVVILFAANINYSAEQDIVYLANNPNVQALLDETDVYIQPLRNAGMEVQLGLLPNHTPAGLLNLSVKGAEMFAYDVASACAKYKLDGASLDEEYKSGSSNSDLLNPSAGGMYLCYELKKQMKELCSWPTQVSVFDFGWYDRGNVEVDGVTYTPGDLIDFHVANYGGASTPWTGQTLKNCSGVSIECNLGYSSINESSARQLKADGYGWCMWFAFHPQVGGGLSNNASRIDPMIKAAARGFYDQELAEPTGYYTKIGEGEYDSTRYARWE
ncbi:MAG: DUF1735 domain-containing protein [Bacteroidales bacterium]|nr:DUF1735 domain-containing protein [Bacteroidales bacterium]